MLDIKNLTVQYGSLKIVDSLSFTVRPQEWLMIVGPNGAGKSTVVSAIAQGVPYSGSVMIDNLDVAKMKPKAAAKHFGVLTQGHAVGYSFTVEEIIRLGRYAFSKGMFSPKDEENEQKIEKAIQMTGMEPFRKQSVLTLSGGELQRTFLAQLLTQDPQLLILDEPTNHLDLVYQKQIFELIKSWIKDTGRAVISVVHDLSLAKAYGTHALLLDRGRVVSSGETGEVLTSEHLNSVYSMDVRAWMRQMLSQWDEK
jgi:iron complex transport system ATP-binding protein